MATMMRALVVEQPDGPLTPRELSRPIAGPGELLVRIQASGVNPLDLKIRAGQAPHARQSLPAVLGLDLAGTVEAVGDGVTRFIEGDAVFGMAGGVAGVPGSLAEFAVVDAHLVAERPGNLTAREAAALPLVAITAWEGLVDQARVAPGERVLVQGGAGGVGHVAIQTAIALGAEVFATGSAAQAAAIASLGAIPIDRELPVADAVTCNTGGRGFDVVYDTVGGPVLDASFQAVRRGGRVVSCLGWGTHALAPLSFRAASYGGVFTLLPLLTGEGRARHGEILREVSRLAEAGKLAPRLDPRAFTMASAEAAHAAMFDRSARGKIVVDIPG
jgi:NADPH:quinone reductase-like Zn-dependent oxidoreductase